MRALTVTLRDLPTPALVLDLPALDRNIARMAGAFASGRCRLRPHVKAHKTPEIARRQLAAGGTCGLTCATVGEAEAVATFCDDLLIANEIVDAAVCDGAAELAASRTVTVAVDSPAGVAALGAAAVRRRSTIGVLVDLDVGQHRCGVESADAAVALARIAAATPGLVVRGVMGYEGHAQPLADRAERLAAAEAAMRQLVAAAEALRAAGLPVSIVSGGGTGTWDLSSRVAGVTEIQAGSYALMDSDYGRLDLPFEQALFLLGTVVSAPTPRRLVANCGHKATTRDHGLPLVETLPDAVVVSLNDEHATIALPEGHGVRVGDRVRLRPSHIDPTMNLHDVVYACEGEVVVGAWPITARGYAAQRRVVMPAPDRVAD